VTAGVSADLLSFEALGLADARSGVRFDPAAELGAGYAFDLGPIYLRSTLAGGLTLAPRDFQAGSADPVYRTPAAYLRAQIELGRVVWKN
jgi:hypothetical protein